MTIQVIIDSAQSIEIDRRKVVGQSVSRAGRIVMAERYSYVPFVLTVTPIARFPYKIVRGIIESIQTPDRRQEQTISWSSNAGLSYITEYTGELDHATASTITINTWTNTTITFSNLPSVGSSTVLFKAGDWIQPTNSRYPYIITTNVLRGSSSTTTGTTHRPLLADVNPVGNIRVGTDTTMKVVVVELPTYKIVEKDYAEYTGDFKLVEVII